MYRLMELQPGESGSDGYTLVGLRSLPNGDNPWIKYHKFVTGNAFEELWSGPSRNVGVDGRPADYVVEAKWTGKNDAAFETSPYNSNHEFYDEARILAQAMELLKLNDAIGGNGVRYAVSNSAARVQFENLFQASFPEALSTGSLRVYHVPGIGM